MRYQDLPDTIGVPEYMAWRDVGRSTADAIFHSKGFPRIKYTGNRLLADKRAVLIYETLGSLNISQDRIDEIIVQILRGEITSVVGGDNG